MRAAQGPRGGFRQPPRRGRGPPVNYAGPDVPIPMLLHGAVWVTPEDIAALAAPCERALIKVERADLQDLLAVILAKFIIELAKEGERDPDRLCEGALKILRKPR